MQLRSLFGSSVMASSSRGDSRGEQQKLGEEKQNPAMPIDPIDMNEIDKFAKALLCIQSIAYGNHEENDSLEQWPDEVWHLHEHCSRHADGLRDLGAKVDEIVQYSPGEWIKFPGSSAHLRKTIITPMWAGAFTSAFISRDVGVKMKWMYSLNHYSEQANLLCKFVIQGLKDHAPKLVYQAQGRISSTRYSRVTHKKRLREGAVTAAAAATVAAQRRPLKATRRTEAPAAAAVAASSASTATSALARSTRRTEAPAAAAVAAAAASTATAATLAEPHVLIWSLVAPTLKEELLAVRRARVDREIAAALEHRPRTRRRKP